MKITIDTKEDSPEEIKKVVAMLSHLIENKPAYTNIFEDSSSTLPSETSTESTESQPGNIFGAMFGDSSTESTDTQEKEEPEEPSEDVNVKTY